MAKRKAAKKRRNSSTSSLSAPTAKRARLRNRAQSIGTANPKCTRRLRSNSTFSVSSSGSKSSNSAKSVRSKSCESVLLVRSKSPGSFTSAAAEETQTGEPQISDKNPTPTENVPSDIEPHVDVSVIDLVRRSFLNPLSKFVGTQFATDQTTNSPGSLESENNDNSIEEPHDEQNTGENEVEGPEIVWLHEKDFAKQEEFDEFQREENCWSVFKKTVRNDGIKTIFRCNKVKRRGKQCLAGVYTIHGGKPDDETISLYRKNLEHTHDSKKKPISV